MYLSGQKQDIPKTTFMWNENTEAEHVFNTCISTACGFFNIKNFLVMPSLLRGNAACVYLPDIQYNEINNFWINIGRYNDSSYIRVPKNIRVKLKKLLPLVSEQNIRTLALKKLQWKKVEKPFWRYIKRLAIQTPLTIHSLEVRITGYGTISSYLYNKKNKNHLVCYLRKDMSVAHLAEIILTALLRSTQKSLNVPWEATEGMVDILLTKSPLAKYCTNYKPTLYAASHTRKIHQTLSKKYVASLGLLFEKPFTVQKDTIYFLGKSISSKLTKSQATILKFCIQNENSIVNYDTLGSLLWSSDEKYSLWAINKQLQRLEAKLKKIGVPNTMFHIVRGQGFVLTNI